MFEPLDYAAQPLRIHQIHRIPKHITIQITIPTLKEYRIFSRPLARKGVVLMVAEVVSFVSGS